MKPTPRWRWTTVVSLVVSALAAVPSAASHADEAVRSVIAAGHTARVIMQFASTAERDAAFNRLLDRGAAVRTADTEAGPALVVFGSAALFSSEFPHARQISLDAGVSVSAIRQPAPLHLAATLGGGAVRLIRHAAVSPWRSSILEFGRTPICP